MTSSIQIDDIYKDLNDFKELPNFENYSISKFGIIYNKNANKISNKFLKPQLHKNGKYYFTKLNGTQYQIKNLLYNTYVDSTIYLSDVKSKYCITAFAFYTHLRDCVFCCTLANTIRTA